MEEREPYKNDARETKSRRKLGGRTVCVRCGYAEPCGLKAVPVHTHEEHHPHGRKHAPNFTIPLCVRCHRELTALMQDAGIELQPIDTDLERAIAVTRANVLHLEQMVDAEKRRLHELESHLDKLNRAIPNWREELHNVELK